MLSESNISRIFFTIAWDPTVNITVGIIVVPFQTSYGFKPCTNILSIFVLKCAKYAKNINILTTSQKLENYGSKNHEK